MGGEYSQEILNELRFPNFAVLHYLIWGRPLVMATRSLRRQIHRVSRDLIPESRHKRQAALPLQEKLVTSSLEVQSVHFQTHRWAFLNDILDSQLHAQLISEWPRRIFLNSPKNIMKSYDTGFRWERGRTGEPDYLEEHPALKTFLDDVRSEAFGERLSAFAGVKQLACYSFLVTSTYPGSCVAPHRDSVFYSSDAEEQHFLNIIFFINGSGGSCSGGLSILKDNTFSDVIFESQKLHNTAIVYDSSAPFFHGFRPVAKGKFRWAVNVQFCAPEFLKEKNWL